MAGHIFNQIRKAISTLNPAEVREIAGKPSRIVLHANSEEGYRQMERFFVPDTLSEMRRAAMFANLYRAGDGRTPLDPEVEVYEQGTFHPRDAFSFYAFDPMKTVREILEARPELDLALAANFAPFREPVISQIVGKVSTENGWFSVVTALPNILPNPMMIPWAMGEFASDSAVLTANQIRMVFLIAGASGHRVGFQEQKSQIASIMAAAFGWRAIARQAVSKIPMGGGVIPKAAVAYAGTWVVGKSFERLYRLGYGYTETERKRAYKDAFEQGKEILASMLRKQRDKSSDPQRVDEELARQVVVRPGDRD